MPTPFGDQLARYAADTTSPPALVDADGEVSYAELHRRVGHAAAWLRDEGCRAGDIVGITVADDYAHLTVGLALLTLGLPQVSLPSYDPPDARLALARRLGVTRVVAADPAHALPGIAASLVAPAALADTRPVPTQDALDARPDAIAQFVASSGSTGVPKLIALRTPALVGRWEHRGIARRDRVLIPTTVEDVFGMATRLHVAWVGATSVFRRASPTAAPTSIAACSTALGVTRLHVNALTAASLSRGEAAELPQGLDIYASGARVPMRVREVFRSIGRARLHVELGAREVGLVCATWPRDRDPAYESVGAAVAGVDVEIVDAEGRALPFGEIGEVRVRTPWMIDAYHADTAATARNFRDGWFHPGDLGSFAPHGSLCLHGRLDDVMNLDGIKIYPAEIERVLEADPAVRAVAAFALRSELHGDIPVAAVEWQGDAKPDAGSLLARARARLGVRAPRRVVVVDALPRNAAGKVATPELARLLEERR